MQQRVLQHAISFIFMQQVVTIVYNPRL